MRKIRDRQVILAIIVTQSNWSKTSDEIAIIVSCENMAERNFGGFGKNIEIKSANFNSGMNSCTFYRKA